jgi:hypothetical protein
MMLDGWEGQGEVVRTPPLPLPHFSVTLATTTTAVLLQSKMRTSTLEEVRGIRKEEKIPTTRDTGYQLQDQSIHSESDRTMNSKKKLTVLARGIGGWGWLG